MNWLLVLPIIIPFLTAAVCLLYSHNYGRHKALSLIGASIHFGACTGLLL